LMSIRKDRFISLAVLLMSGKGKNFKKMKAS